jgi:hypothetical protein
VDRHFSELHARANSLSTGLFHTTKPYYNTKATPSHFALTRVATATTMFDVIWTDPDRELVGERRARKEAEKEMREKSRTGRNSISTRSSSSSSEKPFNLFSSKSLKKTIAPLKSKTSMVSTSSGLVTPKIDNKERRGSYFSATSVAELPSEPVQSSRESDFLPDQFSNSEEHSPSSSSRGIVYPIFATTTAH